MTTTTKSETGLLDFEEYVGDTLDIILQYTDAADTLIDLTGTTVEFIISSKNLIKTNTDNEITTDGSVTIDGISYNIVTSLSAAETETLGIGVHNYFIKTTDSLNKVNTLVRGRIILKPR